MLPRIIRLTSTNVKRLTAVRIEPTGNVVVLGGKNDAGKTSVLDSISMALSGAEAIPAKPVRKGQKKAKVEIDLGDLIVTRTFTAEGGTALKVVSKKDGELRGPQSILDKLVGKLAFDPLEFMRMKPTVQGKLLRDLAGLDFTELDQKRQVTYDKRTVVNRELDALKARLGSLPSVPDGTPDQERSVQSILEEQRKAQAKNAANKEARQAFVDIQEDVDVKQNACLALKGQVAEAEKRLAELKESLLATEKLVVEKQEALQKSELTVKELKDEDLSAFDTQCAEVETVNRNVRAKVQRKELEAEITGKARETEKLSLAIDEIDADKQGKITAAKYPIIGLSVDESGAVLFSGLPLDQAGSASKMRVSLAIGAALNPTLRVMFIRDGSLLDADALKLVAEFADKNDLQIWIEAVRMGPDGTCVYIEDGHVLDAEKTEEAPADTEQPTQGGLL